MTATPRQLSDAVKADYDEILEGRTEESRTIERWSSVRVISGWISFGVALAVFGTLLTSLVAGSLLGFIVFALLFIGAPLLFVPALIVWAVATTTAASLESKRRARMFALYGVTVDRSVEPHVYSVGTLPVSWLKPELHRTRALLTEGALPEVSDTDPAAAGK